jgi:hypothetical protein
MSCSNGLELGQVASYVILLNLRDDTILRIWKTDRIVTQIAWNDYSQQLYLGGLDGRVTLWEKPTKQ